MSGSPSLVYPCYWNRELSLYLNSQENPQSETEQKAQAGNAEAYTGHFGKPSLEGLIHGHGYVEIEKRNDQDDGCERARQRYVIILQYEIRRDQQDNGGDIGCAGIERGLKRLLGGRFCLGGQVFRCRSWTWRRRCPLWPLSGLSAGCFEAQK